jgi:hypothetical protein
MCLLPMLIIKKSIYISYLYTAQHFKKECKIIIILNIEYFQNVWEQFKKEFGQESNQTQYIHSILKGMQSSFAQGQPYYCEFSYTNQYNGKPSNIPMVTAKIIVIIDNRCVSACLDFIDELKAMNYPIMLGKLPKQIVFIWIFETFHYQEAKVPSTFQ